LLKWKKEHSADNYSTIKNESEHDIALNKLFDILTTNREKTKMEIKRGIVSSCLLEFLYHCILDYENKDLGSPVFLQQ
jgi:hypothetical protein